MVERLTDPRNGTMTAFKKWGQQLVPPRNMKSRPRAIKRMTPVPRASA
jgi:hypothetical protein